MTENRVSTPIVAKAGPLENGLLALMATISQVNVLGEGDSAPVALETLNEHRPSPVLLNTDLRGEEEWEVLRQIRIRWPEMGGLSWAITPSNKKRPRPPEPTWCC